MCMLIISGTTMVLNYKYRDSFLEKKKQIQGLKIVSLKFVEVYQIDDRAKETSSNFTC